MIRGLAAPLTYIAALSTSIAVYHTCAEAGLVPQVPLDLQVRRVRKIELGRHGACECMEQSEVLLSAVHSTNA